jgi:hypothetical protein
MRALVSALAILLGVFVAYAATHLALIEIGQEIVVLHKPTAEGEPMTGTRGSITATRARTGSSGSRRTPS